MRPDAPYIAIRTADTAMEATAAVATNVAPDRPAPSMIAGSNNPPTPAAAASQPTAKPPGASMRRPKFRGIRPENSATPSKVAATKIHQMADAGRATNVIAPRIEPGTAPRHSAHAAFRSALRRILIARCVCPSISAGAPTARAGAGPSTKESPKVMTSPPPKPAADVSAPAAMPREVAARAAPRESSSTPRICARSNERANRIIFPIR